jgi:lysozyme
MRTSKQGIIYLASHEAIVRSPYWDAIGNIWTFGLGHTVLAGKPDPSVLNRAKRFPYKYIIDIFKGDIRKFEDRVNKYIDVELTQEQFDALVSFDFNTGGISNSTATRYINEGRSNKMIGAALMMWILSDGKRSKGLYNRRMKEVKLFTTGKYSGNGVIREMHTDGKGNLLKSSSLFDIKRFLKG